MSAWLKQQEIDADWTLFLDRDGVLNRRIVDDYVRAWADWEWLPGNLEALAELAKLFSRIVIVTNQRGISRKLMSSEDLEDIHQHMLADIEAAGGRIDAVYHCPHGRDEGCNCRKPKPGMIFQAQGQFPAINLAKSMMVGDSVSDMELAFPLEIPAIFIGEMSAVLEGKVKGSFPSLVEFVAALRKR